MATHRPNLAIIASIIGVGLILSTVRIALSATSANQLLHDWGYWGNLATVTAACIIIAQSGLLCRQHLLAWVKHHWRYAIGYLALLAVVASHEPIGFKVLFDEHAYAGTAQNMHRYQSATYSVRQHAIWGAIDDVEQNERVLDFRPTLYPFCVHLLHKLSGYRPENSFYTNLAIGFLLLLTLHTIFARLVSPPLAASLVVFLGAHPLWVQNATGGGYDMLNLLLIAVLFLLSIKYLESNSMLTESPLVATVVLLANVRYESIAYIAIIPYLIYLRKRRTSQLQLHWPTPVLLTLLIFPLLINVYYVKNPELFTSPVADTPFMGMQFISKNIPKAIYYLFQPSNTASSSPLFSACGAIALIACLVHGIHELLHKRNLTAYEQAFYGIAWIIIPTNILYMTLFWGEWTDLVVARFSLPMHLLFLLSMAASISWITIRPETGKYILVGVCIYAYCFRVPALARHDYTNGLAPALECEWLERQVESYDRWSTLILTESSLLMTLRGFPAALNHNLNTKLWQIERCLTVPYYQHILVTEELFYHGGDRHWRSKLDYKLSKYFEIRLIGHFHATPLREYRVYEITRVLPHRQKAPEGFKGSHYTTPNEMQRDQELSMP